MKSEQDDSPDDVSGFDTVPAVSILHGEPVVMKNREYVPIRDSEGMVREITDIIDELKGNYERVMVTDLTGITRDRPQIDVLKGICSKMSMWVDAGSRYGEGAIDILIAEADKVVMATKTLRKLEELENALELSENIILGIDFDDGIVSPNKEIREMTPLELVRKAEDIGIGTFIVTDMKNLSSDNEFAMDVSRTVLVPQRKVYVHGRFGPSIGELETAGFAGAIIEIENLL